MARIPSIDIGALLAVTWLLTAVGLTVLLGPTLGARGWLWLGVHHLLCAVGVTHELIRSRNRRKRKRKRKRKATAPR
ncbi:MAG: hypothetical protein AAFV53_37495 [Myxococcota bacterium]